MEIIEAKNQKCVGCGEQASAFWPIIDPDIQSHPYCNKCIEKEKHKIIMALTQEGLQGEET